MITEDPRHIGAGRGSENSGWLVLVAGSAGGLLAVGWLSSLSLMMAARVAGVVGGDGCPDGDLVEVLVVEELQVECFVEAALEPDGCFGDQVAKHREAV